MSAFVDNCNNMLHKGNLTRLLGICHLGVLLVFSSEKKIRGAVVVKHT